MEASRQRVNFKRLENMLMTQTISSALSPLSSAGGGSVNPEMEMKPLEIYLVLSNCG